MKRLLLTGMLVLIISSLFAQEEKAAEAAPADDKPKIDQYFFVMLKSGKEKVDSATRARLFAGHMENMGKLHEQGVLKVAGPFGKNDREWSGIFILDCKTLDEAKKYVSTDPAVKAGLLEADIVPWYTEPSKSFKHGIPEKDKE